MRVLDDQSAEQPAQRGRKRYITYEYQPYFGGGLSRADRVFSSVEKVHIQPFYTNSVPRG